MSDSYIVLKNISKCFEKQLILSISELSINKGEILSIIGPSGVGKSTLLRLIAGLNDADSGEILIDHISMKGIPPQKRPAVYMFQDSLLFPHMNLLENVTFGLKMLGINRKEREKLGKLMLEKVGLVNLEKRFPHEISGGQKQRVALGRSLIVKPKVLLLDEPFSNLDSELRKDTRRWMKHLLKEEEMTVLFVTHDLEEAMAISDRVAILGEKTLQQVASPKELYHHPINRFVSSFLQSGLWEHDRFIASEQLVLSERKPQANEKFWTAEIIESYFQTGNVQLVVSVNETKEKLTMVGKENQQEGKVLYLYKKDS
ncbi:ABC transporter ATP-binding protein [Metabacillus litoralis]|uniref:Carnitine transport ATP-binding protein OpuCA n=1 Tax=Metabacillus litoralis TaxID=152268 RepID=A0A5C6WAN2_9BACI|nr:ABC transporter ATP-binding protein [Metabacillus litoralis]TXC92949.1 ABC transporter ATP-binding protein [Metabacillus litoralis]